jgi:hypothetical protein
VYVVAVSVLSSISGERNEHDDADEHELSI